MLAAVLIAEWKSVAEVSREYQLKAVLLFNLAQFVGWPDSAFDSTNAPLVIGVLGDNPFGPVLEEVVRNEKVHGHPVVVQFHDSVDEIKRCHLLFVSGKEQRHFKNVISGLGNRPILTVADADEFIHTGGHVNLYNKPDGRIGLRINDRAARAAGITVSAKLLRVAQSVVPED